ncbi:MAG: large subunit ribosomal protein L16 [Parcubacteria group bacterium Gr01-1014_18]|nr:MAG: large subunit ribosomal protein L16 [Parcubacteria group bacterium Greene0416_36]TSC80259.1 MAG: large subunit ribosomal protein L16 [Parcubacteria group bacterium Gr01-1014_18]TSC98238.1 MAG: large subunit ribosomal protein L16 [Parcubacteria group bacterium Greene1014_20]TSD07019.1 MAG: large subunit ribosomal protein L16 [Parcubacteria group bacterium Greene0714_2]
MLMPSKVKHRKWQKGAVRGIATSCNRVSFGLFGIQSMEGKWVSARQIESARKVIARSLQKGGKMWIRVFPDKPVTVKGSEVPMGKGKGTVDHYVTVVKPGTVLFELSGISELDAKAAFHMASYKLPVKTKFVSRHNI